MEDDLHMFVATIIYIYVSTLEYVRSLYFLLYAATIVRFQGVWSNQMSPKITNLLCLDSNGGRSWLMPNRSRIRKSNTLKSFAFALKGTQLIVNYVSWLKQMSLIWISFSFLYENMSKKKKPYALFLYFSKYTC